jgi:hypothetical protein
MNHSPAKRVLFALMATLLLIGVVGFAATQLSDSPGSVPSLQSDDHERKAQQLQRRAALMERPASGPHPAVFVEETEHDFKIVDPGTSNEHIFVIENRGQAPLVLVAGETSCKCTLSELEETVVEPGKATEITLTWSTGWKQREHYRQFALIETNDPKLPELSLAVSGTIRERIGFDPPQLTATRLAPDEAIELSTLVYSQLYEDFLIIDVRSNLPDLQFSVEPLLPAQVDALDAKSAYRLLVTLPPGEAGSALRDQLTVAIQPIAAPPQVPETVEEDLLLDAGILPRLAFLGGKLDARYGLDLGVLTQGETGKQKLIVRVRGKLQDVPLEVLEVEPACLQAELKAYKLKQGLYQLIVGVHPDAKPIAFRADQSVGFVVVGNRDEPKLHKKLPVRGQVIPEIE